MLVALVDEADGEAVVEGETDKVADSEAVAVVDVDADIETVAVTDVDTEVVTDGDTDRVTDVEAVADADADVDSETEAAADSVADCEARADGDVVGEGEVELSGVVVACEALPLSGEADGDADGVNDDSADAALAFVALGRTHGKTTSELARFAPFSVMIKPAAAGPPPGKAENSVAGA